MSTQARHARETFDCALVLFSTEMCRDTPVLAASDTMATSLLPFMELAGNL